MSLCLNVDFFIHALGRCQSLSSILLARGILRFLTVFENLRVIIFHIEINKT